MAITNDTVKEFLDSSPSDAKLSAYVDAFVDSDEYSCLYETYIQSKANLIANLYVAGKIDLASAGSGAVKSERAANGSSVTYAVSDGAAAEDAKLNEAKELDNLGCLFDLFYPEFSVGTSGKKYSADNPL